MSTIMIIHSHLKHLVKITTVLLSGFTNNKTTTPVTLKDHISFYQHNKSKMSNLSNIPPPGREYICFQIKWKIVWAAQYAESRALTKVIDTTF